MDKRTILALALVAIVIIITPKLFPSATPVRSAPADSARAGAGAAITPATTPAESAAAGARPAPAIVETPAAVRSPDDTGAVAGTPPPTSARADTTLVRSAAAEYSLSSLGASLLSVRLLGYQALSGSGGNVVLTSGNDPLIDFRILAPGDTLSLRRTPFALERAPGASGTEVLTYRATVGSRPVQVRYTIVPDSFVLHVEGSVGNDSAGTPASFLLVDLPPTLRSFEADSVDDQNHLAFAIKPLARGAEGIAFNSLDPGERKVVAGPLAWAAAKTKYFIVGLLAPEGDQSLAEALAVGGARTTRTATRATGTVVSRLNNGTFRFDLYTGPQKAERLKAMGRDFENSNPYGGWLQGIVQPFASIVLKVLLWMRANFDLGYGWILIIFGIAVRIILWPLNHGAMRTSLKMQRIQPELNEVQKKYKSDPQKLQAEMMRVYKEHDMSPFSTFAGCLPLLLPMPVLFALFFVFQNTIEFRGVPFLWLNDISLKDPYYIVPLLMGGSMFILSWVGMRNAPPNPQAKMMLYVFPVMMTFLFANFASGLNLYYAIQNFAAIPQQWLIAHERGKSGSGKGGGSGGKAKKG